jgi:hypothetical protein
VSRLTQGELLDMPNPVIPLPPLAKGPTAPVEGLTAMRERHRSEAATVVIDEAWLPLQLAWLRAECDRLGDALTKGMAAMKQRTDAKWPKVWLLNARYEWVDDTRQLVERQGHVVACPCGDSFGVSLPPALFHRHLVDEGSGYWGRYCPQCAKSLIQQRADALMYNWEH